MFTSASERSICFFFFYFLFSSSSFIFYSPPSSISSHVTYTYFIVENTRTSDHERQERGRGKEKKEITLLIMTLEGRLDEREADIAIFFNVK